MSAFRSRRVLDPPRRALYTPLRSPSDPQDRIVIVVDDGVATGSTMIAALRTARTRTPKELIAAVAVASPDAARAVTRECDAAFCLKVPRKFYSVGQFFADFTQVEDEEVISALRMGKRGRGQRQVKTRVFVQRLPVLDPRTSADIKTACLASMLASVVSEMRS